MNFHKNFTNFSLRNYQFSGIYSVGRNTDTVDNQ